MLNDTSTSSRGNWITHIDETKRGLAKLLARENLSVRHEPQASTAMFNLETRELILPTWSNITVDQYDLLIGHEVAHAKYSDESAALKAPDMTAGLHSYINVLEDTRIERLIQAEFPGLRGPFRRGYADFFKNGPIFNDIKTAEDAAKFSFIDRVNIHYKIGAHVAVPFSADEQAILPRINNLRSMADAIALARELYAAEKERKQQQQSGQSQDQQQQPQDQQEQPQESRKPAASSQDGEQSQSGASNDEEQDDQQDGDGQQDDQQDSDDQQEAEPSQPTTDTTETPNADREGDFAEPVATTDVRNAAAVRELAEASRTTDAPPQLTLDVLSDEIMQLQTLSSTQYLYEIDLFFRGHPEAKALATNYLAKFMSKYGRTIAQLSQEFERRKTAKHYEHAKQARTGRLDVNKLHAYKFRDDLFKSVTILPNGKSHGIVLLIDGSGSMAGVMSDVLQQTLLFASFAKRAHVPVQAFVFGTATNSQKVSWTQRHTLYPSSEVRLVTLLDSTAPRWNDQLTAVAAFAAKFDNSDVDAFYQHPMYLLTELPYAHLGDTPLYSALMLVERHIARLKQTRRLDKTTLLVLSDGENNASVHCADPSRTMAQTAFRQFSGMILRDRVTHTTYANVTTTDTWMGRTSYKGTATGLAAALVDSIRKRHQTRVVALRLVTKRESPMGNRWHYGFRDLLTPGQTDLTDTFGVAQAAWKQSESYVLRTSDTYFDGAIVIASSALNLDDETDFASLDTTGKTTRQVLSSFKKAAIAASSNRVLINTIVPYLA